VSTTQQKAHKTPAAATARTPKFGLEITAGTCAYPYRRAATLRPRRFLQLSPVAGPGAEPAELALQRRRAAPKGRWLPGREAERFGMGPAIVLGQDVAGLPGPVRDGAMADLAACNRKMRHGYREAAGTCSAHHVNHASSAGVTVPLSMRHTPAMRQNRTSTAPSRRVNFCQIWVVESPI